MPLRFAASRSGQDAILARIFGRRVEVQAANDNGRPMGELMDDPQVLRATLLHFARYGLSAADAARDEAVAAFGANDEDGGRRWLAICRQLDRRMARRLERSQVASLQA